MPAASNTLLWKGSDKYNRDAIEVRHEIGGMDLSSDGYLRINRPIGDNQPCIVFTQNDTTNNPRGVDILNAGTGNSLYIDHDGITGNSINIDAETTTGTVINLDADALTSGTAMAVTADALTTGDAISITSTSATSSTANLISATLIASGSSLTNRTGPLGAIIGQRTETRTSGTTADDYDIMRLTRTNIMNGAGGTLTAAGSVLKLQNTATQTAGTLTDSVNVLEIVQDADSTGSPIDIDYNATDGRSGAITIDADGNDANEVIGIVINVDNASSGEQIAFDIDQVDESKSFFARFNATTAWTSTKDPENDAEAGWIKIDVGGTAYFVPYYAAS